MNIKKILGVVGCAFTLSIGSYSTGVQASVVFQSDPSIATGFADQRGAGSAAVGRVSVSTTQTIDQIGVLNYLLGSGNQNLKFFIADSTTGVLEYLSNAISFANDGISGPSNTSALSYKLSDLMSFTFVAGTTYTVGYISDGINYTYADSSQTNSANGFESLTGNQNIGNFSNPALNTANNCCSIGFELLKEDVSSVPEPTSLALIGTSLVGLIGANRRRNRKQTAI